MTSLPKITSPTFELILPSTGEKILYRPFLVKEEKILLLAKESGETVDIYRALKQVVQNCVVSPENFNVEKIATFDLDYIFIKLRAVSINNMVEFQVKDSDDGITYDLTLDLNTVEIIKPDKPADRNIMIDQHYGIRMKYTSTAVSERMANMKSITDMNMEMIRDSIEYVFSADDEGMWPWATTPEKEKEEFIDSIPAVVYGKIQDFFLSSPKIEHIVKYTNSEGVEKQVVFRTLDDFFVLA